MDPLSLLWLFFILSSLQPAFQRQVLMTRRRMAMAAIAKERQATVISLIHRQESMSLFGFPLVRYIDIDDAEGILRAIGDTPQGHPIEIILHTPGGLVLAAQQIASALADHDGRVTAVVPHYAMSGGTLIAMSADEILIDAHSALGPVDPQLGEFAARSLVEVAALPGQHEDKTLLMAHTARKAIDQVEAFCVQLLERHMPPDRAAAVAKLMSTGTWTHDHPLLARDLTYLGLPVKLGVPAKERELMTLFPQPRGRPSPVEYVPAEPPGMPTRKARQ